MTQIEKMVRCYALAAAMIVLSAIGWTEPTHSTSPDASAIAALPGAGGGGSPA